MCNHYVENNGSFDFFWEHIIESVVERAHSEMDSAFIKECSVEKKDTEKYKESLMSIYKEKREWLKEVYMPHEDTPKLDFHKIGAVLCRSIIKNKPFAFDIEKAESYVKNKFEGSTSDNTKWFVNNLYVNYKVAFYVSVGTIFLQIEKDLAKDDQYEKLNKFNQRGILYFYKGTEKHENFENSTVLALMKNDILTRKFDYLTYAIMLYQLEEYNRILIKNEL